LIAWGFGDRDEFPARNETVMFHYTVTRRKFVSVPKSPRRRGPKMGEFIRELWLFMKDRKKFWLLPIIVVLVLLSSLIVFTSGSAVAPFIYTIF